MSRGSRFDVGALPRLFFRFSCECVKNEHKCHHLLTLKIKTRTNKQLVFVCVDRFRLHWKNAESIYDCFSCESLNREQPGHKYSV